MKTIIAITLLFLLIGCINHDKDFDGNSENIFYKYCLNDSFEKELLKNDNGNRKLYNLMINSEFNDSKLIRLLSHERYNDIYYCFFLLFSKDNNVMIQYQFRDSIYTIKAPFDYSDIEVFDRIKHVKKNVLYTCVMDFLYLSRKNSLKFRLENHFMINNLIIEIANFDDLNNYMLSNLVLLKIDKLMRSLQIKNLYDFYYPIKSVIDIGKPIPLPPKRDTTKAASIDSL